MKTNKGMSKGIQLFGAVLLIGWMTACVKKNDGPADRPTPTIWTCSMHPQIQLPQAGKCPICGMNLIPLDVEESEEGERQISISPAAAKLMKLETARVERREVSAEIRLIGKVALDETRLSHITAWVPGRIDRLYADFTGVTVSKGDHMVSLYSPEVLGAQEELLQALETVNSVQNSTIESIRRSATDTVAAARDKLRLWGLTAEQIQELEKEGAASDHITIYAPTGGVVLEKHASEGMYVKTGTRIYTLADLSHVWVNLDAYESDISLLRYGQAVTFTLQAWPGEIFTGAISFIQPVLDEKTRTIKVRVSVADEDRRLKPGMFVRAVVQASVGTDGKVMEPSLAGKWISPMHPEIVKDGPGECDVCGMKLVKADTLGYVESASDVEWPLVVPASAAMLTGKRAVVYVEVPDQDRPTYEGREVRLGPRVGDDYLVREGLKEGERVVVNGSFKLDAELQIRARPSMMSYDGHESHEGHESHDAPVVYTKDASIPPEFHKQLGAVVEAYMAIQKTLAADTNATEEIGRFGYALERVDMTLLKGPAHMAWMDRAGALESGLKKIKAAGKLEAVREAFAPLSDAMIGAITSFGTGGHTLHRAHCSMALDDGASWLQAGEVIRNPYYGSEMLECGDIKKVLP